MCMFCQKDARPYGKSCRFSSRYLGRDDCEELEELLADWDGKIYFGSSIKGHKAYRKCDTCTKRRAIACAPGSICSPTCGHYSCLSLTASCFRGFCLSRQSSKLHKPISHKLEMGPRYWIPNQSINRRTFSSSYDNCRRRIVTVTAAVIAVILIVGSQGNNRTMKDRPELTNGDEP